MIFKHSVLVRKVQANGPFIDITGADDSGKEVFIVITPDDLHYLELVIETPMTGEKPKYGF